MYRLFCIVFCLNTWCVHDLIKQPIFMICETSLCVAAINDIYTQDNSVSKITHYVHLGRTLSVITYMYTKSIHPDILKYLTYTGILGVLMYVFNSNLTIYASYSVVVSFTILGFISMYHLCGIDVVIMCYLSNIFISLMYFIVSTKTILNI